MISSLTAIFFAVVYLLWALFLIFSAGWCSDEAEKFRSKSKNVRRTGYLYLIMFILLEIVFSGLLLALGQVFLN